MQSLDVNYLDELREALLGDESMDSFFKRWTKAERGGGATAPEAARVVLGTDKGTPPNSVMPRLKDRDGGDTPSGAGGAITAGAGG